MAFYEDFPVISVIGVGLSADRPTKAESKYHSYWAYDTEILYYSDEDRNWIPVTGSVSLELSDLTDVNTSTPTNKNFLIADGVDWESRALVVDDISDFGSHTHTLADITDSGALAALDTVDTAQIVDDAVLPAKIDSTGAYTMGSLIVDGKLQLNNSSGRIQMVRRSSPPSGISSNQFYLDDGTNTGGVVAFRYNTGSGYINIGEFGGGGGSLDVTDGTTTVTAADLLQFDGTRFVVTDLGSNDADVDIAAGGINTTQLADNSITNVKMADNSVDTLELVDDAVTPAKVDEAGEYQVAKLGIGVAPTQLLEVVGSSDIIQTVIKANATQTANVFETQTSTGSPRFQVALNGSISMGVNPASNGTIRLPHNQGIYWRNETDTGDIIGMRIALSDMYLGNGAIRTATAGGTETLWVGSNNYRVGIGVIETDVDGKLHIAGSDDIPQLIVTGNATQTANLVEFKDSSDTSVITFDANGGAVFNEQGNDADFRIEGDTDSNLFNTDASVDAVGIGGVPPNDRYKLYVTSSVNILSSDKRAVTGTSTNTPTAASTAIMYGGNFTGRVTNNTVAGTGSVYGIQSVGHVQGTFNWATSYGLQAYAQYTGSAQLTTAIGMYGLVYNQTNAGTINTAMAIRASLVNANAGTMNNAYLVKIESPSNVGSTITNLYGLHIDDIDAGSTTNRAIQTGLGDIVLGFGTPANDEVLLRDSAGLITSGKIDPENTTITGTPTGSLFLRDDWSWATPAGGGDVSGGGSSTDNAIARWNGATGTSLQDSGVVIDDSDNISGIASLTSDIAAGLDIKDLTDNTKVFRLDVSNITTATTRTFDVPDASTTLVGTDTTQTLTGKTIDMDDNTISQGTSATKTISSGVAAAGTDRNLIIAAESGTADDLIEVTGLSVGETALLRADAGDTITVKHNDAGATVKIHLVGDADVELDEQNPLRLTLVATNVLVQDLSSGGGAVSVAMINQEEAQGTSGGGVTASTWNVLDFNTEAFDPDGIVSVSGSGNGQFTPVAGTFDVIAHHSIRQMGKGRLRVWNVTSGAMEGDYGNTYDGVTSSSGHEITATIMTRITPNGTDAYRIEAYTTATRATIGAGEAMNVTGEAELFGTIYLIKR